MNLRIVPGAPPAYHPTAACRIGACPPSAQQGDCRHRHAFIGQDLVYLEPYGLGLVAFVRGNGVVVDIALWNSKRGARGSQG
jgi:hypothetical protein